MDEECGATLERSICRRRRKNDLNFSSRPPPPLSLPKKRPTPQPAPSLPDDDPAREPIDPREVFDHVRAIADPEHPYSLEQLGVVSEGAISVDDAAGAVALEFTPTVAHCSMATLIGLCLRVRLAQALPRRFKVDVTIAAGKHSQEDDVNRQLADKERVAAALENPGLRSLVAKCLAGV